MAVAARMPDPNALPTPVPPLSTAVAVPIAAPVGANERITTLDLVRGLAVLGILVMNVVEFGQPLAAYENPLAGGGSQGLDRWVWYVQEALFDGKMRALFSMLFGAGLVLLGERMERAGRGGGATDLLVRRCLWLVLFGIVHRFALQWTGDILYAYGLLGLVAVVARQWRPRSMIVAGVLCLGAFTPIGLWHHHQLVEQRTLAAEAKTAAAAGQEVPARLAEARTRWERRGAAPAADASKAEIEAMRGSYAKVFAYRWDFHHTFQSAYLYYYFVWDVLGMMLVGMGLSRIGFFAGLLRGRVYWGMIGLGGLGAIASGVHAWLVAHRGFSGTEIDLRLWHDCLHPFVRGIVGLGWASALILLHRRGLLRFLCNRLAAVGRMALTNYVLQTVCCTLLFFGYGCGLYATMSRSELMLVWAAVSAVQIVVSWLWLGLFRFGPLEWLWRSLVWWQVQPLLRRREPNGT